MRTLKISSILFSLLLFICLASCVGGSHNANTHTHEDGSVHSDHAPEAAAQPAQESFKVEADSTETCPADADGAHNHNGDYAGHDHSGHDHKH